MPDVYRADVYQQLEWVLLDAHAVLLEMLSASGKDEELIAQRCERLSALIDSATIPQNAQLLDLQERVRYASSRVGSMYRVSIHHLIKWVVCTGCLYIT